MRRLPPLRRTLLQWLPLAPWVPVVAAPARSQHPLPADPLGSAQWPDVARQFMGDAPVEVSAHVVVQTPVHADDPMNVPVRVDARPLLQAAGQAGRQVRRIRVVADLNPIRHVLDFEPLGVAPVLAFRMRLEQASAVRALVQTEDGCWHVAGARVGAAGGGCTAPGGARSDGSWQNTLGQVQARWFDNTEERTRRLRLRVMHPMDTGLVAGVPAFHLETLAISDGQGRVVCRLFLHEPVAENPLFTLEWPLALAAQGPWHLTGRDNNGLRIDEAIDKGTGA